MTMDRADLELVEPLILPIGDGSVCNEGCAAFEAGTSELVVALDIKEGLLLASEEGRGKILGCGAGPDWLRPDSAPNALQACLMHP